MKIFPIPKLFSSSQKNFINSEVTDTEYYRSNCKSQYLGKGSILARVLGSYNILLDGSDFGIAPHLILDGYWEIEVTRIFFQLVKRDMTCIDVGANCGYFTILMAALAGPNARVDAFEPNPQIAPLLAGTLKLNGITRKVNFFGIAASDIEGTSLMYVDKNYPQNGHLIEDQRESNQQFNVFEIPLKPLDRMGYKKVDFIKIDAEGHEIRVLEGAQEILGRFSPRMIIEINFDRGYTYDQLMKLLDFRGTRPVSYISQSGLKDFHEGLLTEENFSDDWMLCI